MKKLSDVNRVGCPEWGANCKAPECRAWQIIDKETGWCAIFDEPPATVTTSEGRVFYKQSDKWGNVR